MLPTSQAASVHHTEPEFREVHSSDGALPFRFNRQAFGRLEFLVRQGLRAMPRTGLEIGGVVLGKMAVLDESVVTVTNFVQVEIEYQFGPRFRPSMNEYQTFAEASSKSADLDSKVIGCFRSH